MCDTKKTLRFREDGSFHILMITDLHGGEKYYRPQKKALHILLEETKPDLVILGGDTVVPGMFWARECRENTLRDLLTYTLEELEKRNIPWAHVYGNHDGESPFARTPEAQREALLMQQKVYESFPCCISKQGDLTLHGLSNYTLKVLRSDKDEAGYYLYAMDSLCHEEDLSVACGRGIGNLRLPNNLIPGQNGDSIPLPDQVAWYYETSRVLEQQDGKKVPALMWMHNPLPEMRLLAENKEECGVTGRQGEGIGCSVMNTGLFMACLQRGDVRGIFCGHDHLNDFCGNLFGITMGYAGALYDMRRDRDIEDNRGGREIILYEDGRPLFTRQIQLKDYNLPVEEPWDDTNR